LPKRDALYVRSSGAQDTFLYSGMMSSSQTQKAITKLVTWNIRGLNNPVKRNKIFTHLEKMKSEIVFMQETHMLNKEYLKLKRGGFTQVYHSGSGGTFRGVAILLHRNIQFVESKAITDKNGRYLIIQEKLFNLPVILANIYAHNWDNAQFFKDVFSLLPQLDTHSLILGGDFNCVLHQSLDRSSPRTNIGSKSAQCINSFLLEYGMIDPWRFKYPTQKQISFFSSVHHTYSRIDYFLMDRKLLSLLSSVEYESIVISDHIPVTGFIAG
uniref:exodeoxyribonuclease III n=1 Tax=Pygocentrus nattereri TaxID=42514 RepID=A0AAR2LS66_PYGNA